ncbi:MAG: molecular chaperone HtpG, partial [Victivallales bacterium]|nr:molecular chaperone HtpG [Victivallales bacterium]
KKQGGQAFRWNSKGDGFFSIEPAERDGRGTDVILKLTDDNKEFLDEWKIRKTVERFSNYVEFPVTMDIRREETVRDDQGKPVEGAEPKVTITEETLNSQKAIWQKPKSEVKPEEYNEFYRHISHDYAEPLETIHWSVEGTTEFRALLFIPAKPAFDMFMPELRDKGVQLYVRRVFITDKCEEIVPTYLRFLRGVVDSDDLPLNVSREILQQNRTIRLIQKNLVKKVLDTLADLKEKNLDKYLKFWEGFGATLKEGVHMDFENREKLQDLMLFDSTATEEGKKTSLAEYVSRMPESQKDIYFLLAENREAAAKSPVLEAFRSKGYEVLFCTDPVDEWIMTDVTSYKEKSFRSVDKGDVSLDSEDEKEAKEAAFKQATEENKALLDNLKELLKEKVKEVRLSRRLTDSACCLVGDEYGMSANMERIMKAMHQDVTPAKKILELNPAHPLVAVMRQLNDRDPKDERLAKYARMLYGEAQLMAQQPLDDPLEFSRVVSELLAADGKSAL